MKITESMLRQWVNPAISSDVLSHQLTMAGLEVDDCAPVVAPFSNVVIGEVLTVNQHPDADRLRVTTVSVGELNAGEPLQIVCGAPNVVVGARVPVAMIGAVLPNGLKISKGKLRGVESFGMLCGASEIGLEDKVDGLLILPSDAPIGQNIREYFNLDDMVIELGITPNRGDCLSIKGIAREVAVANQITVQAPTINPVPVSSDKTLPITLQSNGCPRYTGRLITGVNAQAATPTWMATQLTRCGIRTHSILVDITNYVMLELGQPMHAFDADTLHGGIIVRQSNAGETITLLNEQAITLDGDTLLICDTQDKPVAIAGVMGGLDSAVSDSTQTIFLESAFFAPLAIAGRARRYGLHTDSSQRFERGVDFDLPIQALERATQLVLEFAATPNCQVGKIVVAEDTAALPVRQPISVSLAQIRNRLGFDVQADFVEKTLKNLGMHITGNAEAWQVTPPSFRFDMSIKEDITEEIARIYGFDNIPFQLPTQPMSLAPKADSLSLQQLRQTLVTLGYQEAISFSFVDEKTEKAFDKDAKPLALANPISSDLGVMRSHLFTSLVPCLQHNINRQQPRVRLFETGLRFEVSTTGAVSELQQIPTLAMLATGSQLPEGWFSKDQTIDFYDIKGEAEVVLATANLQASFIKNTHIAWLHPGQSAIMISNGNAIGFLGRLHPSLEQALDLPATWVVQFDLEPLLQAISYRSQTFSKFPSVRRDIAVVVDNQIQVADIINTINAVAGELLHDNWLFDVYTGSGIDSGQRSLAFALIWQHEARTLEDTEIKQGMQRVIDALENQFKATLRAS